MSIGAVTRLSRHCIEAIDPDGRQHIGMVKMGFALVFRPHGCASEARAITARGLLFIAPLALFNIASSICIQVFITRFMNLHSTRIASPVEAGNLLNATILICNFNRFIKGGGMPFG